MGDGELLMAQRGAGTLRTLKSRCRTFFYKRCLTGFPWYWPARSPGLPSMVAARYCVRRHIGRDHHLVYRTLANVFSAIVWPFAVLLQLWELRYFFGPDWVPIKRVPGALWAAMRHNVPPGEYYTYALWQPERKKSIDNYLYTKEGVRLFGLLNRPLPSNPIDDKLAFHEMCKAHGLPTPEILAAFAPSSNVLKFETGQPPKRDLFVKPCIGSGGDGTEWFRWKRTEFESSNGCRIRPDDLGDYLSIRARTENRTLLVQPNLSNHPALGAGPNAPLAAARLVTGISTDGNVFPIFGLIYFTETDHVPMGYVSVALIDVASGRLVSRPQELWGAKRSNRQHNLDIVAMPDWGTAMQYAGAAHRACSSFAFIGWDIAFTIQGPILLEGNTGWSASEYQRLRGEPLGHTKFADILAVWLRDSNQTLVFS
jgi:hypothetical protein